jgi:GldL N-terminal domain
MKQKIYILGLASAMIIALGTIFKVNHWAGAGILLIVGISVLVIVFLPVALVNSFKDEDNKSKRLLYIITWLTSFVLFTAMLFKIQHWPGAGYLMLISIPFPFLVFLPVFLIVTSKNKEHSIFNTVYMLFLLMILSCFTALLALNVSKEKLVESFSIVRSYYLSDKAADNIKVQPQSLLSHKIDEVINITEEYRDLYLGYLNIPADMWNGDLGNFRSSLSFSPPSGKKDRQAGEVHSKLVSGLKDLISLMEKTPGCESLAAAAPAVFSLRKTPSGNYNWNSDLILAPVHPWLIAYLEGLENNLKLIRATLK